MLYAAINSNVPGNGFNQNQDSFLQQWNSSGVQSWQVGQKGWFSGGTNAFRRFVGTSHGCTVINDFGAAEGTGADGTRNGTYVWDQNGLWVGSVLLQPNVSGTPAWRYRLCEGDANVGEIFANPTTGNTLYFGSWINAGRVYNITGWNNWTYQNGTVTISTPSTGQTGQGLRGEYFNNPDLTSLADVRVDGPINFNWGSSKPDANLTSASAYSVRWTGSLNVPYGPSYVMMLPQYAPNAYNATEHSNWVAGCYCQFVFYGTAVQWVDRTFAGGGIADVYLDGVLQGAVDTYSATEVDQKVLWSISGLTAGNHTLKIVGTGTNDGNAWSTYVGVDYFNVNGTIIDNAGSSYTFSVYNCDGAHFWLDNNLLVNDWQKKSSPANDSVTYTLLQGLHPLRLDYNENGDPSTIELSWAGPFTSSQVIPVSNLFPVLDRFDEPRDVAIELPGTIQCEDFDTGGQGVAYNSLTATQPGSGSWFTPANYRPGTTPGISALTFSDSPDINQLNWQNYMIPTCAGEWFNYTVNVLQSGTYR